MSQANTPEARLPENKMGVMPVNRLLLSMALPMMASMLVQALYNVVDSFFVAQISQDALEAMGLVFPAQNLMISVAVGTGVGINALLSKSLGEKNYDLANRCAANGVFLALCSWILFALLGLFASEAFIASQTQNAAAAAYALDYLQIVTIVSGGIMFQVCFERLLQSTGKTIYTMFCQGTGAIINIIMDPLLIFGIGPFPELGIAGAAWATVLGQIVGAIMGMVFNHKVNHEITISLRGFRPSGRVIRRIYAVGIPSIIMSSIGSVMTFGMNKILGQFDSAVAVFSAYFKLQSFIFMPVFGLNNGMVPIIAYNYGARKSKRITHTVRLGFTYALVIMLAGTLLFWTIPDRLLLIFSASESMLAVGVPALRIISLCFPAAAIGIVISSVCQALGQGVLSLIVSILRQLVLILPSAWFLSTQFGVSAVWWALPFSEVFALMLSSTFMFYLYRRIIRPLSADGAALPDKP